MVSWSPKSPHPRGRTRRPAETSTLTGLEKCNAPTCGLLPPLAADLAHRPRCVHESGIVDLVLELLVAHGESDQALELGVGGALAQRALQVPFPPREEAGAQLAVGGKADPVAARAERLRDGVDEPDLAGAVGEAEAARGRGRLRRDLLQRPALLDQRADLAAAEHVVAAPRLVGVERHELDEADDVRL